MKQNKFWKKKFVKCLFAFASCLVILTIIFIVAIIVNFKGMPITKFMSDWGEFGSYASFVVSIINLFFFVILTYAALEFEEKSYENQAKFQEDSFKIQMKAQKVEIQTSFRKTHIDDIRQRMFSINNLAYYDIQKNEEDFKKFKQEAELLIRVFNIYRENKNTALFGDCSYEDVYSALKKLREKINSLDFNSGILDEDYTQIWENINEVNHKIIALDKSLTDYTIQEIDNLAT